MPEKETIERAKEDEREGKSASTQAGEFVREEIHHLREGKHGARSTEQAIAIGLSKARRAGVDLEAPEKGKTSAATRKQAKKDLARGKKSPKKKPSPARSRGARKALEEREHQARFEEGPRDACEARSEGAHQGRPIGERQEGGANPRPEQREEVTSASRHPRLG